MNGTKTSNAKPQTFLVAACALFFISILFTIAENAAISSMRQQTSLMEMPADFNRPELFKGYQRMSASEAFESRLYFLAYDLFKGRKTASRGQTQKGRREIYLPFNAPCAGVQKLRM